MKHSASHSQERASGYRPDIDGLRAIAVMAVVAFHAYPKLLRGGFVGVDIFFVISGFLISGIIVAGLEQGAFSFAHFYGRRIRRIFPALIVVLITCLVFGWIALLPDEYRQLGKHTVAGAGFLSNVELLRESGYFDTASDRKPLLHLWSLGIEEQFYLAWPLCLVLLWRRTKRMLLGVGVLTLLCFLLNLSLIRQSAFCFYFPLTRFWELLLGCVLVYTTRVNRGFATALLGRASIDARSGLRNSYAMAGSVLLVASIFIMNPDRQFPGWWALLPTLGAAFLILAGPHAWINRNVLSDSRLVLVGLISYPLYLWHWPLLSFAGILGTPTDVLKLVLIAVSVLLAWITWKFVEINVRQRKLKHDLAILTLGLGFAGLLGGVLFASDGIVGRPMSSEVLSDISLRFKGTGCLVRPQSFDSCLQSHVGPVDGVVVGDSHAESLLPGLAAADKERNWLAIADYGCPPVLGVIAEGADNIECGARMKQVFNYLISPRSPRLIVLTFLGNYSETNDFAADDIRGDGGPSHFRLQSAFPQQSKEEVLTLGLKNAISLLIASNKIVYLMIDVPELPFLPRDCIKRPFRKKANCDVARSDVDERQRGYRRVVRQLQRSFPQIGIFDPLPILCDHTSCSPVSDDFSYYLDSTHLSVRGSERIAKSLLVLINATAREGTKP